MTAIDDAISLCLQQQKDWNKLFCFFLSFWCHLNVENHAKKYLLLKMCVEAKATGSIYNLLLHHSNETNYVYEIYVSESEAGPIEYIPINQRKCASVYSQLFSRCWWLKFLLIGADVIIPLENIVDIVWYILPSKLNPSVSNKWYNKLCPKLQHGVITLDEKEWQFPIAQLACIIHVHWGVSLAMSEIWSIAHFLRLAHVECHRWYGLKTPHMRAWGNQHGGRTATPHFLTHYLFTHLIFITFDISGRLCHGYNMQAHREIRAFTHQKVNVTAVYKRVPVFVKFSSHKHPTSRSYGYSLPGHDSATQSLLYIILTQHVSEPIILLQVLWDFSKHCCHSFSYC